MKYYRLVGCIYIPDNMPTDWAYILHFIRISVFGIDMHLSISSLSYFIRPLDDFKNIKEHNSQ